MIPTARIKVVSNHGHRTDIEYDEPQSLEEAQSRRQALVDDMQGIRAQLGDKNLERDGVRASSVDYWTWRNKAIWALTIKEKELGYIKGWIKRENTRIKSEKDAKLSRMIESVGVGEEAPFVMAYEFIGELIVANEIEMTPDQMIIFKELRRIYKQVKE